MSRRNYINSLDALIGKPYYSNATGAVIDPSTGTEVPTTTFRAEEVPTNEYTISTPPIVAVAENSDLEGIRIQEERRKLEAERLANLTEAEKALRQQRLELAKVKNEERLAKIKAEKLVVVAKPYVAPPLILSGGGGGGGGSMEEPSMPKPASTVVAKPSFLKKNFVPLLLVASAIFVFIKNPIK